MRGRGVACFRLINFGAENGMETGRAGGFLKSHRTVQAVGICESQGGLAQTPGRGDQRIDAVRSGQKRVVTVTVQVDKHNSE